MCGAALLSFGAVGLLFALGRPGWAVGFAVGALLSLGNFQLICRAVARLVVPGTEGRRRHLWKGSFLRFVIVGLALFVSVRYLGVDPIGIALGLVVSQVGMIGFWVAHGLRAVP